MDLIKLSGWARAHNCPQFRDFREEAMCFLVQFSGQLGPGIDRQTGHWGAKDVKEGGLKAGFSSAVRCRLSLSLSLSWTNRFTIERNDAVDRQPRVGKLLWLVSFVGLVTILVREISARSYRLQMIQDHSNLSYKTLGTRPDADFPRSDLAGIFRLIPQAVSGTRQGAMATGLVQLLTVLRRD